MTVSHELKKVLSLFLSLLLVCVSSPLAYGYQEPQGATPNQEGAGNPNFQSAAKNAEQLQALVAPVALYPDALLAQVLSAATFPDQIVLAYEWLQNHKGLTGDKLAKQVNKEPWDPSIKALTQFSSVIDNMNKNLAWTSELGEAYINQPKDVMAAVQVLRAKAKAAGNLKSGSEIKVVQQSPDVIVIEPANPQVVYVPTYSPTVIYGTPYTTPGYSSGDVAAAAIIGFGAGIAIGSMIHSTYYYPWGWSAWSCSWHGGAVYYGHTAYYGNAAWHGAYGAYGYRGYGTTYRGPYGAAGTYHAAGPYGGYSTGGAYRTAYGGQSAHTTYGPGGTVHTGGSGYSTVTGQGYHYGATSTAAGGTAYHGATTTGQRYAGGTTASGKSWSGSTTASGWSSRAASSRGYSSMRASGGFRGRR